MQFFFFGNLAFKYNTSQGRSIVRFLIGISISSQGLEKSNKEIYINGVFAKCVTANASVTYSRGEFTLVLFTLGMLFAWVCAV